VRSLVRLAAVGAALVGVAMALRGAPDRPAEVGGSAVDGTHAPAATTASGAPAASRAQAPPWGPRDWELFASKVRWAVSAGLDTLPPGPAIGRLAESFVGTPYVPGTLEADGPEHLVIDFREFDCVTFVENVLAMSRFIRSGGVALLDDPPTAQARYDRDLEALRYRGGTLDGYPSRLHYFSEWLSDNASRGLVRIVTGELEPATDDEPIDFMSTHPDAYRQLADPGVLEAIEAMEGRLNAAGPRTFVPQDRIAAVANRIETGDVIAATSTIPGLDIAHTGIALWIDGRLHLVHAPLVGKSVEISAVPLADRIASISGQDGIMVARPGLP